MTQRTDSHGRKLSPVDQDALERAIELVRNRPEREGPGRRAQIDHFLKTRPWFEVADFCSHSAQMDDIRPKLWQPVPNHIDPADVEGILAKGDDGLRGNYRAALLLKRMLAAGLSRYEPTPIKALVEAKRRAAAALPPAA